MTEPQSTSVQSSSLSHTSSLVARMESDGSVLALPQPTKDAGASPTPVLSTTIADPSNLVSNTHPMITRAKAGIFKPKVFSIVIQDCEP